jgi:adenylate cyclase
VTDASAYRNLLESLDVAPEEIDEAEEEGTLAALALDRLLGSGPPQYDQAEVARRAGISVDLARRFWRALGFPDVPDGEKTFTDADVEALSFAAKMLRRGIVEPDLALQVTRVLAGSMARITDVELAITQGRLSDPPDGQLAFDAQALLDTPKLMEYVWRRQLQAAARRLLLRDADGTGGSLTVGFADLVGFTALSQELSDEALADVVERFIATAHDIVSGLGGRVVKMIGDEVMYVVDDPGAAAEIALRLAEAYAGDEELSDVRAGLACGPVLSLEGDFYGPVVNLASRIVNVAFPGSVLVSDEVHGVLEHDERFSWRSLRPRTLKGIGKVPVWVLRRASS